MITTLKDLKKAYDDGSLDKDTERLTFDNDIVSVYKLIDDGEDKVDFHYNNWKEDAIDIGKEYISKAGSSQLDTMVRMRIMANNEALERAAWEIDGSTINMLEPSIVESTSTSKTCLIEVRENNEFLEKL